jgi:hypothetical protein
MDKPVILDEWEIKLVIRVASEESVFPPDRWDYTVLLDLNTGKGEQAWVEGGGILRSGTEEDLEFLRKELDD